MKSMKMYLIYAFLFFGTLLLASYIDLRIQIKVEQDYRVLKWITIRQFLFIPVGVTFAFLNFVQKLCIKGVWKYDYKKVITFGIPALYLTFFPTLYFFIPFRTITSPLLMVLGNELYKLGGFILGYVIVSSFYKFERSGIINNS
ncbi:MAG TPA: hypothetical protein VEV44_07735 [Pseudoneobacillus sp.]|nr:hypothetical protein [Pseudoneobacillus sp.]